MGWDFHGFRSSDETLVHSRGWKGDRFITPLKCAEPESVNFGHEGSSLRRTGGFYGEIDVFAKSDSVLSGSFVAMK